MAPNRVNQVHSREYHICTVPGVSTFVFIDIHSIKNERILKDRFNFMLVQEEIGEADLL